METAGKGREVFRCSLSEENYQLLKKCSDIMGIDMCLVVDRMISCRIPPKGDTYLPEFLTVCALAQYSVNLNEEEFVSVADNLIAALKRMKGADLPPDGKRSYEDRIKDYFGIKS